MKEDEARRHRCVLVRTKLKHAHCNHLCHGQLCFNWEWTNRGKEGYCRAGDLGTMPSRADIGNKKGVIR